MGIDIDTIILALIGVFDIPYRCIIMNAIQPEWIWRTRIRLQKVFPTGRHRAIDAHVHNIPFIRRIEPCLWGCSKKRSFFHAINTFGPVIYGSLMTARICNNFFFIFASCSKEINFTDGIEGIFIFMFFIRTLLVKRNKWTPGLCCSTTIRIEICRTGDWRATNTDGCMNNINEFCIFFAQMTRIFWRKTQIRWIQSSYSIVNTKPNSNFVFVNYFLNLTYQIGTRSLTF